ncbi:glycosyltransferase family 2 protein [Flavobacteriaceae bacterium M23B6Z8]
MESLLIIIAIIICISYAVLVLSFFRGISNLKTETSEGLASERKTQFTIIIPFRNEAKRISVLLNSLAKINYDTSCYEFIFVDDASEDDSVAIIKSFFTTRTSTDYQIIQNVRMTLSPKKDAISTAIAQAKFEWILTTDADCRVPSTWLLSFNDFLKESNAIFIAGPVTYEIENTFEDRFELLDFLGLMGSTMGGFGIQKPFLCNGANLAYKKKLFLELNGFDNNSHIAGGDDIFMLQKVKESYPDRIQFLKDLKAVVTTYPQGSFKKLFSQRMRWAAKTSAYKDRFAILTGSIVFTMNLLLAGVAVGTLLTKGSLFLLVGVYLLKFNVDFMLLYRTAKFFEQEKELKVFFPVSLIHPFFNVAVAVRSFFGSYKWKGRSFNK